MATKNPRKGRSTNRASAAKPSTKSAAGLEPMARDRPIHMTTVRLHADQHHALATVALGRRFAEGTGRKPDQSKVLRELLDCVARGEPAPRDLVVALVASRKAQIGSSG
jgi:hypothetical protein